jgi:hypothetical protein
MSKSTRLVRHYIERENNELQHERRIAMNYTLLVYDSPADFALRSDSEKQQTYWASWSHYVKEIRDAGVLRGGAGLELPQNATILKIIDGQRQVQDGPFAETKEQIGGIFIIEVPDLETALDWAARAPLSNEGSVEVRPNLPQMN